MPSSQNQKPKVATANSSSASTNHAATSSAHCAMRGLSRPARSISLTRSDSVLSCARWVTRAMIILLALMAPPGMVAHLFGDRRALAAQQRQIERRAAFRMTQSAATASPGLIMMT
jgi:hypothetical protein